MENGNRYAVIAIPLSRPEIVEFLHAGHPQPHGAKIRIVGQRPTLKAAAEWITRLSHTANPTLSDLLAMDDPHHWIVETFTDRLVPTPSLSQPNFLTRDLGGWVANFFGVAELPPKPWFADPLLNHLNILTDYGSQIKYLGADPALVKARLEEEIDGDVQSFVTALGHLAQIRQQMSNDSRAFVDAIYAEIASETYFAATAERAIPKLMLYEELVDQMVRLELRRRAALADHDIQKAEKIKIWQSNHEEQSGFRLILQGEYIVGRHRRSAVLIAPELGVVIKQPAPEPLHNIDLGAKFVQGRYENWPVAVNGGALIMPRGRLRLIVEEGIIPRLSQVFKHHTCFSLLFGLTVETHVVGHTVQDWILTDHARLTPELYEEIVLHQMVCEILKIDNNDWHAPNFVRRSADGKIVHIDWGAARPLQENEFTPPDQLARLNQVSNMAFSFKIEELAVRLKSFHHDLINNEQHMARLRRRADALVRENSSGS
ncbi:MAG: hypothetical protein QNJ45_15855 [Ardenticatenaceae bacterium]|nr:hypothetical protein [Ardenticatenaceae bacterium]